MICAPSRRQFFRFVTGGAAGISLFHNSFLARGRAETVSGPLVVNKLTATFLHITGAGSNVLAVIGPESVLMVDGGTPERSADLLKLIAEQSGGKPVRVLFNTHWHPDHTGSNETLGQAGARIIAHENTKLWLGAEFEVAWQHRTYEPRPQTALPTQTFYTTGRMMFGNEPVEYGYMLQAHTDGDIYVYFPGPNILVAGDVVSGSSYPVQDWSTGGWIGGMIEGQKRLLEIANGDTRIIPGEGPVMNRLALQAENDMCNTMRERLLKLLRMGYGPKEMVAAAPSKDFDEKWGNPELFILNAYRGLWGHVREVGGIV